MGAVGLRRRKGKFCLRVREGLFEQEMFELVLKA